MSDSVLALDLRSEDIPLESLYLDPNNPRFSGANTPRVPESDIASTAQQDAIRQKLVQYYGVAKLKMNMEVNGYLPIDRIIVRAFENDKYVVLEGNRRICAAKLISTYDTTGQRLPEAILETFRRIPCLVYVGALSDAAWIFQGLRHITGVLEWSAYHKAKLLVEQMDDEGMSLTEVGKRFGLTAHGAGQWVRGYKAYQQATEETDYVDEIDERAYPLFQEIFSRSSAAVREWLQWSDREMKFSERILLDEFVSWLYPRQVSDDDDDEATIPKGDWERRKIRRQDDIRNLAYLIRNARDEFEMFRREQNLDRAYQAALAKSIRLQEEEATDRAAEVFHAIAHCRKSIDDIPVRMLRDSESKERLMGELASLQASIKAIENSE